jgi:cobalt-zinc-cadmium efflux system protein
MSHSHDHTGHSHSHNHAPSNYGRAFGVGIALNTLFIIIEVIYGLKANSLALLADAGHNASDVLGLVVAWVAVWLTKRKPNARYTYGLQSSSILAALANAVFLLVAIGGIVWEAIQRINHPEPVMGNTVMIVAAVGIFINGFTALLFMRGSKGDLNIRGAFLHMATDAVVSLGVVISGLIMLKTGWLWLDPVVSITIAFVIVIGTWGLLRDSINLALHAVPAHIDHAKVKAFLAEVKGVKEVHDLHIWAMSTTEIALSAHLVMPDGHPGDIAIKGIAHELEHDFNIGHVTLQIELGEAECALAPEHVV